MSTEKMVKWFLAGLIITATVLIFAQRASATDDRDRDDGVNITTGDVNVDGGDISIPVNVTGGAVDVAGDTLNLATGGNKSYNVVAPGLGDVDIAQCLGSEAWTLLVGGKQKLVLNQVCMAEFYLKQGKYKLAAQALCNQPEILDEYKGKDLSKDEAEEACEAEHDFSPVSAPEPASSLPVPLLEIIEDEHDEDIEMVQMAQVNIEQRLESIEKRLNRPAPKSRPVVVEQRPAFTEEQRRAALAALMGESKDEDDE